MSTNDTRHRVDLIYLQQRTRAILAGDAYPEARDRLMGCPPYRDSPHADLRYLAETELARGYIQAPITDLLAKMASAPGRWTAAAVRAALLIDDPADYADQILAIDYCMALLGDRAAQNSVASQLTSSRLPPILLAHGAAVGLSVARRHSMVGEERSYASGDFESVVDEGWRIFKIMADAHASYQTARAVVAFDASAAAAAEMLAENGQLNDELDDDVVLMLEDRSATAGDPGPRSLKPKVREGLVVVPVAPDATGARKDTLKGWTGKIGVPLPLVKRGDIFAQRMALIARFPHAVELIDTVLADLSASENVRFRPTLFVGSPGSGKSSLARAILETVNLPCELFSLAGVHDASMMGTSAQWASARESAPLQLIKRTGSASVGVIWDEVEKVGTRKDAGSALDALLPMLEPDQARRYRDLALEVEVDLSAVSHFATANSMEGIPGPLRDRMRILIMPQPGWQHLSVLTTQIVERLARERGIDPRWYDGLAEDEMELVREAWPGGSIRRLTRIVTTIVDGRDLILGRA